MGLSVLNRCYFTMKQKIHTHRNNIMTTTPYLVNVPTRETYTIINNESNQLALEQLDSNQQRTTVTDFQNKIQKEYPQWTHDSQDVVSLIRFLKARDFDLNKSFKLFVQRMQWIESFQPHKLREEDIRTELMSGLLFWYGRDYFSRPIVHVRTCNHFPVQNDEETERFFKYFVYMCELGLMNAPKPPYNQFVIISDQSHLSRKNLDISGYRRLFCLADYYPEVIHSIHVIYQPLVFNMMYKIGKQFLDKKTLSKVQLKSKQKKKLKEELLKITSKECLLPDHFGYKEDKRVVKTWLPDCCPDHFVFATMRGKSSGGIQPYGAHLECNDEEESNEEKASNDGVDDDLD
jgi:hypothetical protein